MFILRFFYSPILSYQLSSLISRFFFFLFASLGTKVFSSPTWPRWTNSFNYFYTVTTLMKGLPSLPSTKLDLRGDVMILFIKNSFLNPAYFLFHFYHKNTFLPLASSSAFACFSKLPLFFLHHIRIVFSLFFLLLLLFHHFLSSSTFITLHIIDSPKINLLTFGAAIMHSIHRIDHESASLSCTTPSFSYNSEPFGQSYCCHWFKWTRCIILAHSSENAL